jgi:hypothetical protein
MPGQQTPKNESQKPLTFLERFVSKNYAKQPLWVRTFVYLVFAILLAFALYRLVGGYYCIQGQVYEKVGNVTKYAKNYDITVGKRKFGTNSLGQYYVILNPAEYYRLILSGNLPLRVHKGEILCSKDTLKYDRMEQVLEDITLAETQEEGGQDAIGMENSIEMRASPLDFLIPLAYAGNPERGDRLFITGIQLGEGAANVRMMTQSIMKTKECNLMLDFGGQTLELLTTQTGGTASGPVPVMPGQSMYLGTDYYFDLSRSIGGKIQGKMVMSVEDKPENFNINMDGKYGEKFNVIGNLGSRVEMMILKPYDVVIWESRDILSALGDMESVLTAKGYRVVTVPLSREAIKQTGRETSKQTNAVFGGNKVPFEALQDVIPVLKEHGVEVKAIRYGINLRSGNQYQIQVGNSAELNDKPPLPENDLRELIQVRSEEDFKSVLKRPR